MSLLCVLATNIISYFSPTCDVVMGLNIYFYLAAFAFLLIESLIILHKLVDKVILAWLENSTFVILAGLVPPLLYTLIILPFFSKSVIVQSSM